MGLSLPTAERWVDRWERQQQRYAVDREERFTVVTDVVEHVTEGQARPYVLDLGCGPGSLPARLSARLPHARIVAVDMDPLLLELARTRHPHAARYVQAVIGEEGWTGRLGLTGPVDAVVSTTALHYLPEEDLRRAYADLTGVLRPGGVLVNADHLGCGSAALAGIAAHVGARRARRAGALDSEDWESWWAAAADDPELGELCALREPSRFGGTSGLSLGTHIELLRAAGFAHAGPVWQVGTSHALVAALPERPGNSASQAGAEAREFCTLHNAE
ncbi:class I SAM-dependent methyltransferase [Streptomyces sp. NRRL F-5630]|uniref:class I SAM-dependent methyltransferase n=1 Tax=Streptomyces sp. NRRL F-5630 TaxID=1463864 RepID=UPI000AAA5CFE|nr:class I SAM-dependent methyltransferase [Streptomyces sp. NRRL F-5630]